MSRQGEVGDAADWCGGHGLPESMCTLCNPELTAQFKAAGDWCAEHSLPESACPKCNPMQPPSKAPADAHLAHEKHAVGESRVGDAADWCGGHGLPESMCTLCNPELTAKFKAAGDWCAEHSLPESACPKCNPMQPPPKASADAHEKHAAGESRVGDAADWCGGHGLPESMCTLCNPELTAQFKAAGDWCAEHSLPESACPKCNPMQPPPKASNSGQAGANAGAIAAGTRIRFRTAAIEQAARIQTVPATRDAMGVGVEAVARIDFNRNAMADVRSSVTGIVREVAVDLGQRVAAGDRLFVLESAQVGDLQARRQAALGRLAAAKASLARREELRAGAIASQRQVELARQELAVARAELRGIDQSLRMSGAARRDRTGRFEVHAPIAGVIIRRPAIVGSLAGTANALATVADSSVMWAMLDVGEWDAASVAIGQPVSLVVDGLPGGPRPGVVAWIASEVDRRTRAVSVRVEVPNPDGALRAGQFARATVQVAPATLAASVPKEAVQRFGASSIVFVRVGAGVFEPRVVQPGRADRHRVQVVGAVVAGEPVVTTGAFLLRTELDRDSIGAGCCEVEGPGAR